MKTKHIGVILIGICIILLFVLFSFINELNEDNEAACGCAAGTCPMSAGLPLYTYIGVSVILIVGILGIYLVITARGIERIEFEDKKKLAEGLKTLNEDEKKIYEEVYRSDGVIFQSDLVEKTKLPKAKVSRILDKLEGRGLVERRRRGIHNLVLLKKT